MQMYINDKCVTYSYIYNIHKIYIKYNIIYIKYNIYINNIIYIKYKFRKKF